MITLLIAVTVLCLNCDPMINWSAVPESLNSVRDYSYNCDMFVTKYQMDSLRMFVLLYIRIYCNQFSDKGSNESRLIQWILDSRHLIQMDFVKIVTWFNWILKISHLIWWILNIWFHGFWITVDIWFKWIKNDSHFKRI